jgi:hypothetical protein
MKQREKGRGKKGKKKGKWNKIYVEGKGTDNNQ